MPYLEKVPRGHQAGKICTNKYSVKFKTTSEFHEAKRATDLYTRGPLAEMRSLVDTLYNYCFPFGPGRFLQHTECMCRYRLYPCNSTPKDIALKRSAVSKYRELFLIEIHHVSLGELTFSNS